jgi:hypothetical protein
MPKKLMLDIFRGHHQNMMDELEPANEQRAPELVTPPEGEAVQAQDAAVPAAPGAENVA